MRKHLLLSMVLLFALTVQAWAQLNRSVSGQVTSSAGTPLPGVSVIIKGTTIGASTDVEGRYNLNNIPANANTLVFKYLGFADQEVAIGDRNKIDVKMQQASRDIQEVVVVGYGTQTREELTGSIASVTAEDLEDIPVVSVDQALQGRAAGVQVTQNSGTPGGGIAVRVRGAASIGASNEPLYVVDGIPINTGSYSAIAVGNQQTNALSDINPNDIQSIEVLKDAASAAIYGSRASNGVVLITTKRGSSGKTKVNFNYYTGFQKTWNRLDRITGQQQVELYNEMVNNRYPNPAAVGFASGADLAAYLFSEGNTGEDANGLTYVIDNGDGIRDVSVFRDPSTAFDTDWQDQVFRTAPISNYDLSISGGNERTKFLLSGSYFDQEGILIGSSFERMNGRLNLDHSFNNKLRVGTSLGLSRSVNSRIQNDNNIYGVLSTAILVASDVPPYLADGTYAKDPGASTENPLAAAYEPTLSAVSARVIGNAFAEWDILPDLRFRSSFGIDYLTFQDSQFNPSTTNAGAGSNGEANKSYRQDINWLTENTFNYNKTFGEDHNFSALLGISYQQSTYSSLFASATNFPGNDIKELSAGSLKTEATSGQSEWGLASYFSRFTYALKGRYLFSASIRADGSSRFGEDNRYGVFPAASVGWRVSEEPFMQSLDFLSDLKLRASYGITGNSEIGNFASLGLVGAGFNYIQQAGLAPTQLANPSLTWEETAAANIGLDLGFLNNRITLNLDVYKKITDDLLLARPLVGSSGFTSIQENIGSMENKGLEIALTSYNIESNEPDGFNWSTNFNLTFNRNEITKLYGGNPYPAGFASWVEEGQPIGSFRGYRVGGIFQTQDEINALNEAAKAATGRASAVYQSSATRPGDIRFIDLNGDGVITSADQEILGSAQPKFTGGLTNNLSYQGFDLSFFFQFNYGNDIYNNTRAFSEGMNGVFGQTAGVLDRWTPENTDTDVPRAVYGDPNNNRRTSDRWIEDGSYLRLKNTVLGYTLPTSLSEKIRVSNLRVYVSGQNLLTFTDYSGLDPEVNTFSGSNTALGTDFLTYPQARTITFGVNIGL